MAVVRAGELVERADELAAVERVLAGAAIGEGRLLLIEGPAGAGKTALLSAAAARARGSGVEALVSRAGEFERGLAFEIARQLLERPLARDPQRRGRVLAGSAAPAAALLGDMTPAPATSAPVEARHALYWAVANLADETPLVLIVDDLQWADPSSQEWLLYLARRLHDLPASLVVSWRTDEHEAPTEVLDRLRDEPIVERLRPAPLTDGGVAAVVRGTLGAEAEPAVCTAAHRLTAGNPFLLAELLRSLRPSGQASVADIERARPESVERGITRRLARLGAAAQALANSVAILGDGCEFRHAAALAGLEQGEAIAAADELATAGILAAERPLRFEHPLVRAAVHDAQPLGARDQAHLEAARLLAAERVPVERIASHLLAAPALGDPWVAEQLETAGMQALGGGAPTEAAELLERALAEPPPAARRARVLMALGRAEHRVHRPEAPAHLEEAIAVTTDPTLRAEAAWSLAMNYGLDGRAADAERILLEAAESVRHEDPEQHRRLQALLAAMLSMGYIRSEAARAAIVGAVDQLSGATPGERLLLASSAYERLLRDETPDEAADLARRALEGGLLFSGAEIETPGVGQALNVLLAADRLEEARDAIDRGLEQALRTGSVMARLNLSAMRCNAGWLAGDLLGSEADGQLAVAIAQDMPGVLPLSAAYLARTLVDRGRPGEAEPLLEAGPGMIARNLYWSVLAHLRDAQGRPADAAAAALSLTDAPLAQAGMSCAIPWRLQAAIALAATGDADRARELLSDQRAVTARWGIPRARAALQRAHGLVESDPFQLEAAVATLEHVSAPLERARTLIDLGAMRRRAGQRSEAREVLRAGLDLAHRCGADGLGARATEELAACGARPRRMLLTGPESLTAAERRVATLAGRGMSNPEIAQALYVSRKTVETQLASVYRKLDINSRGQLPAALSEPMPAAH